MQTVEDQSETAELAARSLAHMVTLTDVEERNTALVLSRMGLRAAYYAPLLDRIEEIVREREAAR